MSDLLDEIMQTPVASQPAGSQHQSTFDVSEWGGNFTKTSLSTRDEDMEFRSLAISEQPVPPHPSFVTTQYEEEMDWSPTQSKHRAFSSFRPEGPGQQGFSQAPTEAKKGHFWYRVPPAPTTPAQRLFNPPNQSRLRKISVARPEISFRGANDRTMREITSEPEATTERSKPVTFAEPAFFPPMASNDPRNSLSDMFNEGFTLRPDREKQPEQRSWVGNLMGLVSGKKPEQ